MGDLFDLPSYPDGPGHRGVETSVQAADAIAPNARSLQAKVLAAIRQAGGSGLTTNECCDRLGFDRDSIQPRTSELRAKRLIVDSGQRRRNASGKRAIVWVAVEHPAMVAA